MATPNGAPPPSAQYATQAYVQQPGDQSPYPGPPAKRQRLSPEPQSPAFPYANGAYRGPPGTGQQPGASAYGNPYAAQGRYGQQQTPSQQSNYPPGSFNTPDLYQGARQTWQQPQSTLAQSRPQAASPSSSQMMPPPPKPVREEKEEKVGVDDINDALFSSGINLKEEENYMHSLYNNKHGASDSFASHGASFGSSSTGHGGSFSLLTQGTSFSSQPNSSGAGTMRLVGARDNAGVELERKRTAAARHKAEHDQQHLRNPFLLGNVLRLKMESIARGNGISVPPQGLYVIKQESRAIPNGNTTDGVQSARPESQVDVEAPVAELYALVALAAGERLRSLLDETYALARARRYGDHGKVPVDFADIAVGDGEPQTETIVPQAITGTPWDQIAEGTSEEPQTTYSFQSRLNNELRSVARRDQDAERARVKKREARRKAAENASNDADITATDTSAILDTTMTSADSQAAKITKKELARQQKEKASLTEQQAATTTNQAAAMAIGLKAKKYNWMTGASSSMPTNRFAKPAAAPSTPGSGSGTPSRKDGTRTPVNKENTNISAEMTWGQWRESGKGGQGIQLRDWLLVLERDGRQKKAWELAALRLGSTTPVPAESN